MRAGEPVAAAGPRRSSGFTLLILLGLIAAMGAGLAWAGPAWKNRHAREREQEWLRVGELYARALTRYVAASPGNIKAPPTKLEQLLTDTRFVGTQRYLRQLYADPLRPGQPWAVLQDDDGHIVGVYSPATDVPFLTRPPAGSSLQLRPSHKGYASWVFLARLTPISNKSLSS